ncbi:Adenosine deaminase (Adenosine aminohydrolase) [Bradyrhizobium sp. ORS 285]|uniref:adenosine deaminase n=1 Tax=Bradyrhizobium sp. ORS 285 TaxID=115808 RepID=UPI00054FFC17|nr:adenosine deaminase [Bradyrhizobium sp. ORS 285]SMX55523.1 Adenosine deaminase (Adenosine aminohydrolase) [Bradyrhizobium sp. ORS 285]
MPDLEPFIRSLPKTELHMHIEGSIEPEMMFALAERNGIDLKWDSPEALRAAYEFSDLKSFLDLYFEGCRVLVSERDFYDVTTAYLRRAVRDGVVRAELFLGPQSFTERGVPMASIMKGIFGAIADAERDVDISAGLMVSAHRHRSEADAMELLDQIMPWADQILGIGMGGPEVGHPPSKFKSFFRECRNRGFRTTIHAGEEGPASYVREAIEVLQVDRIDHGNACLSDPALTKEIADRRIALTVCPLSNVRLKVVPQLDAHPLRTMLRANLLATVNSDDPPYFGGYVSENLIECQKALGLSKAEIVRLVRNGFEAAFITADERSRYLAALDDFASL